MEGGRGVLANPGFIRGEYENIDIIIMHIDIFVFILFIYWFIYLLIYLFIDEPGFLEMLEFFQVP